MASELNAGLPCHCNCSRVPAAGSFNWAIPISFSDGSQWILRSSRNDISMSADHLQSLLASEVATLNYIRAHSTIPVPEIFAYSTSANNNLGIPYILMSKAHGWPLQSIWKTMSLQEKRCICVQLGMITKQLSLLRFPRAGSLFEEDRETVVKTCLSRGLLLNGRSELDIPRGPFATELEYYNAHISAFTEHARYGILAPHCFLAPIPARTEYGSAPDFKMASDLWSDFVTLQSKIENSNNRVDYIIAGDILSEAFSIWIEHTFDYCQNHEDDRFVIHHPDINVNNVFVNHQLDITCIIDWMFCSTVPLPVLLTPPGLPQSRYELDQSLISAFQNGFKLAIRLKDSNGINVAKSHSFMIENSRPIWLFTRFMELDTTADYQIFQSFLESTGHLGQVVANLHRAKQLLRKYRLICYDLMQDDETADAISKAERRYFLQDAKGLAISRKLSLVSQWSSRYRPSSAYDIRRNGTVFVADKKLWRWISDCLRHEG